MSNHGRARELLEQFHQLGITDAHIARQVQVPRPTISRIRTGVYAGERTLAALERLAQTAGLNHNTITHNEEHTIMTTDPTKPGAEFSGSVQLGMDLERRFAALERQAAEHSQLQAEIARLKNEVSRAQYTAAEAHKKLAQLEAAAEEDEDGEDDLDGEHSEEDESDELEDDEEERHPVRRGGVR